MHVVAHNASPVLGGGEIWLARLLAGLQGRGHRVLMLCRNESLVAAAARHGVEARVLRLGGDALLPDALRFAWMLRRLEPDAVLLTTFKKIWLGGLGARLARVPHVLARVAVAGQVPRNWTYRLALRRWVDTVVLNAEALREPFLAALPGHEPARVLVVHDGVAEPVRQAAAGALRRTLNLPPQAQLVGAVARLVPQKRLDRLLHALAALPASVHCVLAGEGPERASLEALATTLGVRGRLHWLGFRTDVGDVLDALDVFVVSSDREGMANAMLEALCAGVPVVSTDVSGAAEALDPLPDGTAPGLVVGFDAAELAAALRRLLDDEPVRARMRRAARQRVRQRFSFERMLERWEAVLDAAPGARARRSGPDRHRAARRP